MPPFAPAAAARRLSEQEERQAAKALAGSGEGDALVEDLVEAVEQEPLSQAARTCWRHCSRTVARAHARVA